MGHWGKQFTCRLSVGLETQAWPGLCAQVPRVQPWSNTSPPGLYRIMQFYLVRADFPKWDIWENNSAAAYLWGWRHKPILDYAPKSHESSHDKTQAHPACIELCSFIW